MAKGRLFCLTPTVGTWTDVSKLHGPLTSAAEQYNQVSSGRGSPVCECHHLKGTRHSPSPHPTATATECCSPSATAWPPPVTGHGSGVTNRRRVCGMEDRDRAQDRCWLQLGTPFCHRLFTSPSCLKRKNIDSWNSALCWSPETFCLLVSSSPGDSNPYPGLATTANG